MRSLRARLQGASLAGMFAWFTGFYFVGTYAIALMEGAAKLSLVEALIRGVSAALFGGIMTAITAWRRRQNGGVDTLLQINKAIKTGQVPEDAEPSIWVPAVELRRRQSERAQWVNPIIFGLFTVLCVWLITQEPTNFLPWVGGTVFVAIGVASPIQAHRAVGKIDALLAQLHATHVDPPRW